MKPTNAGQIVKFHTPYQDEELKQLYVVIEIHSDTDNPGTLVKATGTGMNLVPSYVFPIDDLVVVNVNQTELIRHRVTIQKTNYSQATGKVIRFKTQDIVPDLSKSVQRVETNVNITIADADGNEHSGFLLVR